MTRGQIWQNFPKLLRFMALFPFPSLLRAPHMKMWGFKAKRPESSAELRHKHCHGVSLPSFYDPDCSGVIIQGPFSFRGQQKRRKPLLVSHFWPNSLGQKSCRTKVPEFFEFLSRLLPRILLRIFPKIFKDCSCFVSWETETRKFHQRSPPFFNAKFPGKHEQNYSQNVSGEQAK